MRASRSAARKRPSVSRMTTSASMASATACSTSALASSGSAARFASPRDRMSRICGMRSASDAVSPPVTNPLARATSMDSATRLSSASSSVTSRAGGVVNSMPIVSSTRPRASRCWAWLRSRPSTAPRIDGALTCTSRKRWFTDLAVTLTRWRASSRPIAAKPVIERITTTPYPCLSRAKSGPLSTTASASATVRSSKTCSA